MKKKKILFLNHAGVWGGASISLDSILSAVRQDYDIEIANILQPGDSYAHFVSAGYPVVPIPGTISFPYYNGGVTDVWSVSFLLHLLRAWKARKRIEEILRQSDADVVVANSVTLFYVGRLICRFNKVAVCFQRETLPETLLSGMIRRYMAKWFDAIVFISKFDASAFDAYSKVRKYVVYDKINLRIVPREETASTKTNNLLFLGDFKQIKGTMEAIKAVEKVPYVTLTILSQNSSASQNKPARTGFVDKLRSYRKERYRNRCLRYIEWKQLNDRILIKHSQDNVCAYMQQCDAVLFTATKAHQTRLIYETALCDKPIVVPAFRELREFCYEHVFTYCPGDTEDCARVIREVMAMPLPHHFDISPVQERHDSQTLQNEIKGIINEICR